MIDYDSQSLNIITIAEGFKFRTFKIVFIDFRNARVVSAGGIH